MREVDGKRETKKKEREKKMKEREREGERNTFIFVKDLHNFFAWSYL